MASLETACCSTPQAVFAEVLENFTGGAGAGK
jgi:hypothetical protein